MFGIAGTVELGTICPGTGTWNRLQDGNVHPSEVSFATHPTSSSRSSPQLSILLPAFIGVECLTGGRSQLSSAPEIDRLEDCCHTTERQVHASA